MSTLSSGHWAVARARHGSLAFRDPTPSSSGDPRPPDGLLYVRGAVLATSAAPRGRKTMTPTRQGLAGACVEDRVDEQTPLPGVPEAKADPVARIVSPRLAHPEQSADFRLEVTEEALDARL